MLTEASWDHHDTTPHVPPHVRPHVLPHVRPHVLPHGIRRAVRHIEANFADPIRLAELAAIAGLSLYRFVTVFRLQLGVPPHRYVNQVRVREARSLLRRGLPLATVALETGFFDQSHLSRHFKRQCGMTPGLFASTQAVPDAIPMGAHHAPD